jgi:pimeloyl-ACP methyl ester carboxylesterase
MKQPNFLNHEIAGTGPTVVLLHGYMASLEYWRGVAAILSQNYRVVTIDLLGFGNSPKPKCSRYDYEAHVGSLEATLVAAGVTGKFVLVGHSMGSLVSLRFARRNPERIEKLILTNMPIMIGSEQARAEVYGTRLFYRIALKPGFHTALWPVFKLSVIWRLLRGNLGRDLRERRSYLFKSTGFSRLRSLRNVIFDNSVDADLKAIGVATVLLSGMQDRKVYLQNLMAMALQPNITTRNVEGGHHLPLTRPELVAETIRFA